MEKLKEKKNIDTRGKCSKWPAGLPRITLDEVWPEYIIGMRARPSLVGACTADAVTLTHTCTHKIANISSAPPTRGSFGL